MNLSSENSSCIFSKQKGFDRGGGGWVGVIVPLYIIDLKNFHAFFIYL